MKVFIIIGTIKCILWCEDVILYKYHIYWYKIQIFIPHVIGSHNTLEMTNNYHNVKQLQNCQCTILKTINQNASPQYQLH